MFNMKRATHIEKKYMIKWKDLLSFVQFFKNYPLYYVLSIINNNDKAKLMCETFLTFPRIQKTI